jgi:hypothetical protein
MRAGVLYHNTELAIKGRDYPTDVNATGGAWHQGGCPLPDPQLLCRLELYA